MSALPEPQPRKMSDDELLLGVASVIHVDPPRLYPDFDWCRASREETEREVTYLTARRVLLSGDVEELPAADDVGGRIVRECFEYEIAKITGEIAAMKPAVSKYGVAVPGKEGT